MNSSKSNKDGSTPLPSDEHKPEQAQAKPKPAPPIWLPGQAVSSGAQRLPTLGMLRFPLCATASSLAGFMLGAAHGGQVAQLRFRAEHAHKMPDTTTGWYLYHKSKNYHVMVGSIREGLRMGAKAGVMTAVLLGLEAAVDEMRGRCDMLSTITATVSVAGLFSLRHRFSLAAAARTTRYGLAFGVIYGGTQDLLAAFEKRDEEVTVSS